MVIESLQLSHISFTLQDTNLKTEIKTLEDKVAGYEEKIKQLEKEQTDEKVVPSYQHVTHALAYFRSYILTGNKDNHTMYSPCS